MFARTLKSCPSQPKLKSFRDREEKNEIIRRQKEGSPVRDPGPRRPWISIRRFPAKTRSCQGDSWCPFSPPSVLPPFLCLSFRLPRATWPCCAAGRDEREEAHAVPHEEQWRRMLEGGRGKSVEADEEAHEEGRAMGGAR